MDKFPQLNFPAYRFKTTLRGSETYVWDSLRGSWLLLTPEEWVRQHTIYYLRGELGALEGCIVQEHIVDLGGSAQRADIVVFSPDSRALMLVECKAATVEINRDVLAQAVRYNSVVGARYILLTNGLRHYFYELTDGTYAQLKTPPKINL